MTAERIAQLEARLAELEARMVDPTQVGADDDADEIERPRTDRRRMLRLAGATVLGAVAASAAAGRAAADQGVSLTVSATSSSDVVRHNYTGGSTTLSGAVFQSGTTFPTNASTYPAALAGWSGDGQQPSNGIYGYAGSASGIAVVGFNGNPSGGTGMLGRSDAGVGVHGSTETGTAVRATANNGVAIRAIIATTAMFAEGNVIAVEALAGAPGGVGVRATGVETGVFADSILGAAVQAWGIYGLEVLQAGRAALRLHDMGIAGPNRVDAHVVGEIDFAAGDVWLCVGDGTPGRWITLGGTRSAGAFHAIAPVRVYDSRLAIPEPGAMTGGTSRVVGVADARDATGAVATTDVVPAGATAIAYNLTITETVGSGFLSVAPGDASSSTASSINWSANGQNLANGLVVKLDGQRRVKVFAGGGGSTHVIIDVLGYYR